MIKSDSIHQNPTTWGSRPENTLNMTTLQVFLLKDSTTGNWLHWFPIKGPQTASSTFQQDVWDVCLWLLYIQAWGNASSPIKVVASHISERLCLQHCNILYVFKSAAGSHFTLPDAWRFCFRFPVTACSRMFTGAFQRWELSPETWQQELLWH